MTIGPNKVTIPVRPYGGNVFATVGPDGALIPAVRFTQSRGAVRTAELAALQAPGNEVFIRSP